MTAPDPKLVEAAARALREDNDIQLWGIIGHEDYYPHIVRCILAAVTPLIEAATLERTAKEFRQALARYAAPDDTVPMQGVLDILAAAFPERQ
jgi:hypothetical protein